ncbi:ABC transporter substrate-binding protein [Glycomyces luteolus]|uniref:ABC transporter substrate-binding protein n=1 Tax=Glycomyces luteolus TaxID=2670330 RepID=A0A9X3PC04_9ACTN|nr:ABC transporter substrate-binding protein [Glycomyces luteolus]MDA1360615.1 ABC transporter substrate-binding protein [Glycomyces luteolus]
MALTRRALGGLTIGGTAAFTLAACGGNEGNGGSGATELTWAVSSSWESWNENTESGNNSYGHQAMYPMRYGLDGSASGDFDENGDYYLNDAVFADAQVISEAPFQVEYTLQENAQWSDGKPVRVEDFIFQWYSTSGNEAHADQTIALPASISVGSKIASIESPEAGKIVVTFVEGHLDFEWKYSATVYLPSHVAEAEGFADWQTDPAVMGQAIDWFNKNLSDVCTGPWKPVDSKMGEYIVYEINDKYQGSVKPSIKKLTMKFVEGTPAIITELRQGTIAGSWPSEFSQEELDKVKDDPAIGQEVFEGSIWLHIDTNLNSEPLKDVALRQAIFTAINVPDAISRVFPSTEVSQRMNHFFGVNSPYFTDYITPSKQGSGDTAAAAAILTEAGYTGAAEGQKLAKDGTEVPKLVFRYGGSDATRTTIAELAQAQLALIGITLELVAIPDGELGPVLSEGDFDLVIFGWSGNPAFAASVAQQFGTDQNFGNYSYPEIDAEIAKISATLEIDEAAEAANKVVELAVANALTLPLFDEPQSIVWNKNTVDGVVANGNTQGGPLYNAAEWKLK